MNETSPKQVKLYIVYEEYAGIKNLSEIFADLIYAEYCKQRSENADTKPQIFIPDPNGQTQFNSY